MKLPLKHDFTNKVVVITGAGGVLCGVMARAYAQAGAKVAALDLNEEAVRKLADELKAKGDNPDFEEVLKNLRERDYIDSHREVAPLRQADDALVLDNSEMTREEQMQWLLDRFEERTGASASCN